VTLCHTRTEFIECPTCIAKPGSPTLCRECLERRELFSVIERLRKFPGLMLLPGVSNLLRVCPTCKGEPNMHCKEHGR
jgi:hypothetical protein